MLCKDKRNRKLHEIRCEIRRLILQLLILTFGRLLSGIFYFCCEVERRQDFSLLILQTNILLASRNPKLTNL